MLIEFLTRTSEKQTIFVFYCHDASISYVYLSDGPLLSIEKHRNRAARRKYIEKLNKTSSGKRTHSSIWTLLPTITSIIYPFIKTFGDMYTPTVGTRVFNWPRVAITPERNSRNKSTTTTTTTMTTTTMTCNVTQ